MDFWQGLLAGFVPSYNTTYKHALDSKYKDRDYELAKQKLEEDRQYKQEHMALLRPYYESQSKLHDIQGKTAQQKYDLMRSLDTQPKSLFDLDSPTNPIKTDITKPTSYNVGNLPWVAEESYNRPDAVNPKDGNGSSFGLIQANAPDTQERMFRNAGLVYDDPETGERKSWFGDMKQTDPAFHAAFQSYVQQDPQRHAEAQLKTAQELYRDPMIAKAKQMGLDMSNPAVENAVVSAAIQHGVKGASNLLELAKSQGDFSTPESAIDSIFKTRAAVYPKFSDRYERERTANIGLLKNNPASNPTVVSDNTLPEGSIALAANSGGVVSDAPNGFGRPSTPTAPAAGSAPSVPATSGAGFDSGSGSRLAGLSTQKLQDIYSRGAQLAAQYQNAGLHNPYTADMKLIEQELSHRANIKDVEARYSMSQKPEKYIDMNTGEVKLMTPLDLSKVKDASNIMQYDEKPSGLGSRINQYETIIANKVKQFIDANPNDSVSEAEKERVALANVMRDNPELFRRFQKDLIDYRKGMQTPSGDRLDNKTLVETNYSPSLERTAENMADITAYNKVGSGNVQAAYGTLTNMIEGKKAEIMANGVDEPTAYAQAKAFAQSTPEGKAAYDTIAQAYNGGDSAVIKSGRVTSLGDRTLNRHQTKQVSEMEEQVRNYDMSNLTLKDTVMTPEEKANNVFLSDDEMNKRIADRLSFIQQKGTGVASTLSKFFNTGDSSLLSEFGDNARLVQELRSAFLAKRKAITGVAFGMQEGKDLAQAFLNAGSSPQEALAALQNEQFRMKLMKDAVQSIKTKGDWNVSDAYSRLAPKPEQKQATQSPSTPEANKKNMPSYSHYGD